MKPTIVKVAEILHCVVRRVNRLLPASSLLLASVLCSCAAHAQHWLWSTSAGGAASDVGSCIARDASGNVYVAGWFESASIVFGSTTLIQKGGGDIYLVKYDVSGNVVWARSAGGTGSDDARAVAIDPSGNVYVAGSFSSPSFTFGASTLTNSGSGDVYVAKYDEFGSEVWAASGTGSGMAAAQSLATDASDNVIVAGWFAGSSLTFGTTTITNAGNSDIFTVKYDPAGNIQWASSAGGAGDEHITSVKTDAAGRIIFAGYFNSLTMQIGTTTLTSSGNYDMFVAQISSGGSASWAKSAGGTGDDEAQGVATDPASNVYVVGNYASSTITFGTQMLTNTTASVFDPYLVKYDASGNVQWARGGSGTGNDEAFSVAADASGNVYTAGGFNSSSLTIGTTTLINTGGGNDDVYVTRYSTSGNFLWAVSAGSMGDDYAYAVVPGNVGEVYVTGYFDGPLSCGTLPVLSNAGGNDMFVAKIINGSTAVDMVTSNEVMMYPNPTGGCVTISSASPVKSVIIYNAIGQEVFSSKYNTAAVTIDVTAFAPGMYFARIDDDKVQSFYRQ